MKVKVKIIRLNPEYNAYKPDPTIPQMIAEHKEGLVMAYGLVFDHMFRQINGATIKIENQLVAVGLENIEVLE